MRLVWLSWYISGMLALLFVLLSLVSYGPGAERAGAVMQAVSGSGALVGTAMALWLTRLPRDHWVHRSKPIWSGFIAAAATVTLLVVLGGFG
jgi:hypothetical protein